MSGGQQGRRIEESAWEGGPPSIPDLRTPSGIPASASRRRRSSADTMPASDPFSALQAARPDWCVDLGPRLSSMTTFELWEAIEHGDVAPRMRVWREGLECWTAVGDLPELQWAVASAPAPVGAEVAAPAAARAANDGAAPAALEAARPEPALEALTPQPALTPAPEASAPVTRRPLSEAPARAVSRQRSRGSLAEPLDEATPTPTTTMAPPLRQPRRGGRWVFAGSAVASVAIAFALLGTATPPASPAPEPPAAARAARLGAASVRGDAPMGDPPASPLPGSSELASTRLPRDEALDAASLTDPFAAPPVRPAGHREERGQRRQPRGGRRVSGR